MSRVFVIDSHKQPLNPVHPGRARWLLKQRKAAVFKRYPFTIILLNAVESPRVQPLRIKLDPGSLTTGIAIVSDHDGQVLFGAELAHRGRQIKKAIDARRAVRHHRRARHTRYRQSRFDNRRRSNGWLAPSLMSRVYNVLTWVNRLRRLCPIAAIGMEFARFDPQVMEHPDIEGCQYQQGTLAGYEVREYLLEKWARTCAYCGKRNIPLQIEHIIPRAKGGTDRVSNLTLACERCNRAKGTQDIAVFLKKKPARPQAHSCPGQSPTQRCSGSECDQVGALRATKGHRAARRVREWGLDQVQSKRTPLPEDALARRCVCGQEYP